MIRGLKGVLALVALAGLGRALRWMTAGTIDAANSHDLDSMTVLAVGTVAWMAYGWLTLAVLATVLEQIPGAIGAAASTITGRITSQTSRTLLRSALGLAAITPLTITTAQATPPTHTNAHPTSTPWRTTEPPSTVRLTPDGPSAGTPTSPNRPTTEPRSTIRLTNPTPSPASRPHDVVPPAPQRTAPQLRTNNTAGTPDPSDWRPTEPPSSIRLTDPGTPAPATRVGRPHDAVPPAAQRATSQLRANNAADTPDLTTRRTTEPSSTVRLTDPSTGGRPHDAVPPTPQAAAPHLRADKTAGTPNLTNRRPTEPPSSVRLSGPAPSTGSRPLDAVRPAARAATSQPPTHDTAGTPHLTNERPTEPPSSVRLTDPTQSTSSRPQDAVPPAPQRAASQLRADNTAGTPDLTNWRTTEPPSTVRLTGPTGPAPTAAVGRSHDAVQATAGARRDVPGGAPVRVGVPDRPTAGAATRYTDVRSGQPVRVPARVVVKPGDTLWSIAATDLGPNATPEDIAARWPAWYDANRQQIGPDPDLILPGQVLRIPASATGNPVPPTHQEK